MLRHYATYWFYRLFSYVPSQADVAIFEALSGAPAETLVHARRWYNHINSYSADERLW